MHSFSHPNSSLNILKNKHNIFFVVHYVMNVCISFGLTTYRELSLNVELDDNISIANARMSVRFSKEVVDNIWKSRLMLTHRRDVLRIENA